MAINEKQTALILNHTSRNDKSVQNRPLSTGNKLPLLWQCNFAHHDSSIPNNHAQTIR